jgi:pyrophosphatase PpaX
MVPCPETGRGLPTCYTTAVRFDAVLFDLDGTLLDSIELILASYHHTLAQHGISIGPQPDEDILSGLGTTLEDQFSRWVSDRARIPALIDTYRSHNLAHHDAMVRAYPGVSDVVRALDDRGAKLGVVTSKRRHGTELGLRALGLEACFDVLVCADDVARAKPHPEPVLRALDALGVAPARACFVGDSTHDMHSGRAAGVHTIAVLWGPFTRASLEPTAPDAWASDARELAAIFEKG